MSPERLGAAICLVMAGAGLLAVVFVEAAGYQEGRVRTLILVLSCFLLAWAWNLWRDTDES